MNGRASRGMSAHLRNSLTRPRIEFRYRSTTSAVSTSTACTWFVPFTSMTFPPSRLWPNKLDREWTGFRDASRTRSPWDAKWYASPAAATVLPTPPFPPVKMYRIFGRCSRSSGRLVTSATSKRGSEEEVVGHRLDHVESARLARVHREHGPHLPGEFRADLIEVLPLHPRAVPEELHRLAALRLGEFGRLHLIHDEARHLEAERIEHLEGSFGIQDCHALRDEDHEERRAALVHHQIREPRDLPLDVLKFLQDFVLRDLRALQGRRDRFVFLGLLPGLRDLPDPLAQDLRHRNHADPVAERGHVEHVKIVPARRDEVCHGVVRGRLVHRRFRGRGVDVLFDFRWELRQAIHREDLLLHLDLIVRDAPVCVDLHDVQIRNQRDEPPSEDVPIEDVAEARLRVRREAEDLPVPLRSHVVAEPRAARRLAEPALPREDHDSLVALLLEVRGEAHRTSSEHLVREVPLPEHPLFPALDVRDRIRQDLEGVVRRGGREPGAVPPRC